MFKMVKNVKKMSLSCFYQEVTKMYVYPDTSGKGNIKFYGDLTDMSLRRMEFNGKVKGCVLRYNNYVVVTNGCFNFITESEHDLGEKKSKLILRDLTEARVKSTEVQNMSMSLRLTHKIFKYLFDIRCLEDLENIIV